MGALGPNGVLLTDAPGSLLAARAAWQSSNIERF